MESEYVHITPLGAGNEVGRSCHILQFKGKTVMLDCGIHPGGVGIGALPYLDAIDPSNIDLLLVSHFHLDHAAALPYFLEKTNFKGRVFMTHPTKSIYKLILLDYVKVSTISVEETLYDEKDLINSMKKIECLNFGEVVHHNGIKFWCYNAGHVLGAAMFMIEIAGVRVLYTGDYSCREDRHLMSAEVPSIRPDILIVESTYGVQTLQPIKDRERRFTELVHRIIRRGGRVLIPVFALGRAQELLLILEEYWEANPSLQDYPIYYASALAKKCMLVYQAYIHMMNKNIQQQHALSNPFIFKHISNLKGMDKFDDVGPSVVMASPGMLQNGLSRELFELWCTDAKNGCIIPGYCVEGTLAKSVMSEPSHITTMAGLKAPLKMSVNYVSFSAHADYSETSSFIDQLKPPNIVLVHGDSNEMSRLRFALQRTYSDGSITISTPKNCQTVEIEFRSEKFAKIVGRLAVSSREVEKVAPGGENLVSGLFIRKDFVDRVLAVDDLPLYTPLASTTLSNSLKIGFHLTFDAMLTLLARVYDIQVDIQTVEEEDFEDDNKSNNDKVTSICVLDSVNIMYKVFGDAQTDHLLLKWDANPFNDAVADSISSLLLTVDSSPAVALSPCHHRPTADHIQKSKKPKTSPDEIFKAFFDEHFGGDHVSIDSTTQQMRLTMDKEDILVDLKSNIVQCQSEEFKTHVEKLLGRVTTSIYPCQL